jgi:hypothetical protein
VARACLYSGGGLGRQPSRMSLGSLAGVVCVCMMHYKTALLLVDIKGSRGLSMQVMGCCFHCSDLGRIIGVGTWEINVFMYGMVVRSSSCNKLL